MTIQLTVLPDRGVAVIRASGEVGLEDVLRGGRVLVSHPDWQQGFRVVLDYRGITRFDMDGGGVKDLVAQDVRHEAFLRGSRCAVIASRDLIFGMSRVWTALSERGVVEGRVFRQAQAALQWLQLEPGFLDDLPR